jgi:hypothetical protein
VHLKQMFDLGGPVPEDEVVNVVEELELIDLFTKRTLYLLHFPVRWFVKPCTARWSLFFVEEALDTPKVLLR